MFKVTGNVPMQASTQKNLATIQRDLGDLQGARRKIESSLTMVESLRGRYTNQDFQTKFFATTQEYFSFYIELLMRLHKQEPSSGYNAMALEASERARARSLLDLLVEAHADIRQGVDPQLLEQERSLQKALNAKSEVRARMMKGRYTTEEASDAAKEIDRLTAEYQDVQARLRKASPRYAALTQPQPLDLKGIQANLDKEMLLLQYALGDKQSYLWLVSPTTVQSFELPSRKEIEAAASNYYELLNSVKDPQNKDLSDTASDLAEMLLKPVATQLGEKRLVIVADGALQYVPFAALPESIGSGQGSAQPLIVNHEIVSLPSISVLDTLRSEIKGRNPSPLDIAVLADPVFDPADKRVKKTLGLQQPNQSTTADIRFTAPLPSTKDEAEGIVALGRPNKSLKALDFEANRALVIGGKLNQYRYVHFATHGLVDSFHPELSAIVLSLVKENGAPQDGYLRAHEIYNINLPADLVVLSACETALGKEVKGEGLISLTRALMYAGAPRVIVSLWAVRDESTAELMVDLYRGMIKQGKRPAEALRAAQIEMLKRDRWSAPHYWAPFVLQGEWR
jgi:CHAT domain-containing protein